MSISPLSFGKIAYKLYFGPKRAVQQTLRQGVWNAYQTERARRQMEKAALTLRQPLYADAAAALPVSFLTGKRYWYQTAFCAYSLARHAGRDIHFHFHDDGSFDAGLIEQIHTQFPLSTVVTAEAIGKRIAEALPLGRYPLLHHKRQVYPHIKKLTDIHAGRAGWQLVLDSDMLFFRKPDILLRWLENPDRPLHMVDVVESYGYPAPLMSRLAGAPLPSRINVGVIGLNSNEMDWDRLEHWIGQLEAAHGPHYLQEQALTAMLLAGRTCTSVPEHDYVVCPDAAQMQSPRQVLHHYVARSKEGYYRKMWARSITSKIADPQG